MMEGFGRKSVSNMLRSLEKARKVKARNLLYALSIPLCGTDVCKRLLAAYPLKELATLAATTDDTEFFAHIDGIGPEKSAAVVGWFHDAANNASACRLLDLLDVEEEKTEAAGTRCDKLTFVITGDVHHYKNRNELKAYIESQGGKVTGSVSKSTNFLINNDTASMSSKNKKAHELNIPIIALSQLNRGVESREGIDGKRPQLSDLRESGAIEQDADMVCFIHRPEYYKIYSDEKGNDLHGMAEIIIAKHRNGAVGDVLLRFRGEFARFQNPDDDVIVPMPGEAPGIIRSKMNGGGNSVPPPSPDAAPADNNPFGAPIPEGPLPF